MLKVTGAELGFEVRGTGPDVVFVQGVGLTGAAWSPQIDELARDHRCIALDNRGTGKSTGDTSKLSIDLMARDALALMDALEASRAHLVGHSLGGVIVQRMALLAPERVASLTFMCTFCGGRDLSRPSARLVWLGMRSRVGTRSMRRAAFARLIMPDAYLRERGELHKLARLRAIVLSGRHDPIATHACNAELARSIGAVHRVWEDASHALPIQHAGEVNAALREHFAGDSHSTGGRTAAQ